ncbi:flagellar biosynthetic protein FliO [Edaphobacter modestus]|uniref:Flagellar biosynthesis protein FliO n=1 Tax=Edaphobacter modestus TaxID=388466 RepID=A0A4Q7YPI0_9BACT|nr:flagellar biosynthetic protein FliO [Edaphobacter modestus]RZU39577.1 flagellar biosynthesis protein FliO [Edaphobacter modestus]
MSWKSEPVESAIQHGLAGVLLRMWANRRSAKAVRPREIELLETFSLGGRRELMLVRCAGERFLVGGSFDRIETMVKLEAGSAEATQRDGLCG